jgi:hypothetical protein
MAIALPMLLVDPVTGGTLSFRRSDIALTSVDLEHPTVGPSKWTGKSKLLKGPPPSCHTDGAEPCGGSA